MRGFFGFLLFGSIFGCGNDKFSGADGAIDPDGSTDASMVSDTGVMPGQVGCADGTREAFRDRTAFPLIAACSGGFAIPGTQSPASMTPQCNRLAGNSGSNPNGTGCTIEDLCQQGWHVCRSATDVRASLPASSANCQTTDQMMVGFWLTRQTTNPNFQCMNADMPNNVVGCASGMILRGADTTCSPLTHVMSVMECVIPPWSCAVAQPDMEAMTIVKPGQYNGGVMCCSGT